MPTETKINSITAESLREYLIRIAQNKGLSYEVIARRCIQSGEEVSKSTVAAFFNNPDLDLGYKKLMAISRAVSGYDTVIREFTEPLPLKPTEEADYMRGLMEAKKDRILDLEKQLLDERARHKAELDSEREQHKTELAEARKDHREALREQRADFQTRFDAINKDKKVWRSVALFVLIALAVFCVVDVLDTDSGWIQASGIHFSAAVLADITGIAYGL